MTRDDWQERLDPDGDVIEAQERFDRRREQASLDGEGKCPICDVRPKEIAPGFTVCLCTLGRPA